MNPVTVIWSGPKSGTLDSIDLPEGSLRIKIQCTGTEGCRSRVAEAAAAAQAAGGMPILLVGFSAGHGVNDALVGQFPIAAYVALDSYYASQTPAGLLAYAERASSGDGWMVTTTSDPPGASWRTCEQNIQPLLSQLKLSPADVPDDLRVPATPGALARGGYLHLPYGGALPHEDHAALLGPIIIPWVVKRIGEGKGLAWQGPAVAIAAGALSYLLVRQFVV